MTKTGRPVLHGGFSVRPPGELLRGRPKARLRAYLTTFRRKLIEDLAAGKEEDLTAGQLALIDRAVGKLAVIRMMEMYIADVGPWKDLKEGQLRPVVTGPLLAYSRELRADLQALGLERRTMEEVLTPAELVELIEAEPEKRPGTDDAQEG